MLVMIKWRFYWFYSTSKPFKFSIEKGQGRFRSTTIGSNLSLYAVCQSYLSKINSTPNYRPQLTDDAAADATRPLSKWEKVYQSISIQSVVGFARYHSLAISAQTPWYISMYEFWTKTLKADAREATKNADR